MCLIFIDQVPCLDYNRIFRVSIIISGIACLFGCFYKKMILVYYANLYKFDCNKNIMMPLIKKNIF